MEQKQIAVVGATRIAVGLSAIIKVAAGSYEYHKQLKILSGGGTLEIVAPPVALTGSSAAGWAAGYPVGGTEVVTVQGPAVFYFAATGATMTLALINGSTNGATLT